MRVWINKFALASETRCRDAVSLANHFGLFRNVTDLIIIYDDITLILAQSLDKLFLLLTDLTEVDLHFIVALGHSLLALRSNSTD